MKVDLENISDLPEELTEILNKNRKKRKLSENTLNAIKLFEKCEELTLNEFIVQMYRDYKVILTKSKAISIINAIKKAGDIETKSRGTYILIH